MSYQPAVRLITEEGEIIGVKVWTGGAWEDASFTYEEEVGYGPDFSDKTIEVQLREVYC